MKISEYEKKKLSIVALVFLKHQNEFGSKMMSNNKNVISRVTRIFHFSVKKVKNIQNFPDLFW